MSYKAKKAVAAAMCASMMMALGACGTETTTAVPKQDTEVAASNTADDIADVISDTLDDATLTDSDKDESVYVIADATGKSNDVIVSEWLKNTDKKDTIQDASDLTDIKNVKGDETFTQKGNTLTWQADGNPIYYQGKTDKALPVSVKVSYYLNGKEVQPSEIAGKSGKVKIRFDYENKSKDGDVYTPFVMATGLILDAGKFSNVEVKNGKMVSDGSKFIVVGMGLPGLKDSLDLEKDIDIPDYVEVTADASDFQMDMSVTVASTNFLGGDNSKDISLDNIENEIDKKTDQLDSGVDELADGIKEYTDGVSRVADGADQLDSGAGTLKSGADQLKSGAASAKSGSDTLKAGLDSAYEGSKSVSSGAKQVNDGASQVKTGIDSAASGASQVKDGADSAASGAKKVSDGASQLNSEVQKINLPDVSGLTNNLTAEQKQQMANQIKQNVEKNELKGTTTENYVAQAFASNAAVQQLAGLSADDKAVTVEDIARQSGVTSNEAITEGKTAIVEGVNEAVSTTLNDKAEQEKLAAAIRSSLKEKGYSDDEVLQIVGVAEEAVLETLGQYLNSESAKAALNNGLDQLIVGSYAVGYGDAATQIGGALTNIQSELTTRVSNVASAYAAEGASYAMTQVGTEIQNFAGKIAQLKSATSQLSSGAASLSAGLGTLASGTTSLNAGLGQLQTGSASLASGTNTLATGADSLESGLGQLDTGAASLSSGLGTLASGTSTLASGAKTLKDGTSELKSGTKQLTDNSDALVDGGNELKDAKDEILDKINSTEKDANEFVDRVNKVKRAGDSYESFGGISDDMQGSVKFIIRTEGVTTDENDK